MESQQQTMTGFYSEIKKNSNVIDIDELKIIM